MAIIARLTVHRICTIALCLTLQALLPETPAAWAVAADLSGWGGPHPIDPWPPNRIGDDRCNAGFVPMPWELQSPTTSMKVPHNINCTSFLAGDVSTFGVETSLTLRVDSSGGDGDYIGVAFGYDRGDLDDPGADYFVLIWALGPDYGLRLLRVVGAPPTPTNNSWIINAPNPPAFAGVTELGQAAIGGWVHNQSYDFDIALASNRLRVRVNGSTQFDLLASDLGVESFDGGDLAFFNFSQAAAFYQDVTTTPLVCGDGFVNGSETCDDGNIAAGDCCPSDCGVSTSAPTLVGGPEIRVTDDPIDTVPFGRVASNGAGNSLVAWSSEVGGAGNIDIFGRILSDGVLGPVSTLSEPSAGRQFSQLIVAADEGYLLGFTSDQSNPPDRTAVFLRQLGSTGAPAGTSVRVSTQDDCYESGSGLARDSSGTISLTWSAYACATVGGGIAARARAYDSSLTALGIPFEVASFGHGSQVAALGEGTFVATYRNGDANIAPEHDTIGRRFGTTSTIGSEFLVPTAAVSRPLDLPNDVVGLPDGAFVAFWQGNPLSSVGGTSDVYGRRFEAPSYAGGDAFRVNDDPLPHYDEAGANTGGTVLSDGNIAVAWGGFDADGNGIFVRVLDPYGTDVSGVIAVNTTTAGAQVYPDVAPRPDGGFTVVWSGDVPGGHAVFAREFSYSVCGDGAVEGLEQCDDGNTVDGDECNAHCQVATCADSDVCNGIELCDVDGLCQPSDPAEAGTPCDDGVPETTNDVCDGNGTCSPVVCGDGVVAAGAEQCDDSNSADGDCCSSTCQFEETGTSCADADVCDGAETCDGAGTCQAALPASAGTSCPDADLCDGTETCDGSGSCHPGTPVICSDGALCNGSESCDPGTGSCLPGTPAVLGTSCEDDNNPCTVNACNGSGACQATPGNAGTECRASAGQCDVAEVCSGGSAVCPPNSFKEADSDCDDGSALTCPDKCDGSGTCVPGDDESTDCRNTCCDGVDNDGDESTDIEDSGCGLGQESRTAVVTTSPKRNAIRMGGRVNIASLDLEIDRPDCDEPYIYRTEAGICGERMSLRKNGEVGFIATLATEAVSGTQPVVFGKGFDIRSHWVSIGMPAESQEPPPLVGPGTCNPGGESCTQPLTPLNPGDACPSASAGACCPSPSALCEGRMDLFDPNNPHVITDGSHPDYARCQTLRTELALSSDAVAALAPNHPDYSNVDDPERIRVLPATPIPVNCDNVDEDPAACTAACAQYCTVTVGAGQQVLYVDSIDVKRNMTFRICRDFNLTPSDPPTVAIFRIEDKFALSPGARIEACGVPPDRILWNAEGEKGSVKFARGADLIGTVLAPRRKSIKFGGDATLKGSLFAPIVTFSKFTEMYHYPFSAGIE